MHDVGLLVLIGTLIVVGVATGAIIFALRSSLRDHKRLKPLEVTKTSEWYRLKKQ